jgi:hypothetical protein
MGRKTQVTAKVLLNVLFLWAREIGGIEGEEGRGRGVEDQIGSMVNGMFLPEGANHSTHTH